MSRRPPRKSEKEQVRQEIIGSIPEKEFEDPGSFDGLEEIVSEEKLMWDWRRGLLPFDLDE